MYRRKQREWDKKQDVKKFPNYLEQYIRISIC